MRFPEHVLFAVLSCVGCGGSSDAEPPAGTGGTGGTGGAAGAPSDDAGSDAPAASIRFSTDHGDVTRVYFTELVAVHIEGVAPKSEVVLSASMGDWTSESTFEAAADGSVDLDEDAPKSGSYSGVDPEGPFWSMSVSKEPATFGFAGVPLDVTFEARVGGELVASATLERPTSVDGLVATDVSDGGLVGIFVAPEGASKLPAILAFGGSEGGLGSGETLAYLWAAHGYACLGIAYFGAPGLPDALENVPLEYFGSALDWLAARPEADADAIAVMGASRGGEAALLLAANFPQVKATVAQVPSGLVWPGFGGTTLEAAWTKGGEPLPYVPPSIASPDIVEDEYGHSVYDYTPVFEAAIAAATPEQLDAASARVEDSQGAILMLAAADDKVWPSCELADFAWKRLVAAGHDTAHGDAHECYEDAGHFLGGVGIPSTRATSAQHPVTKQWLAVGGTHAGIAHAARKAYDRTRSFLGDTIGSPPTQL